MVLCNSPDQRISNPFTVTGLVCSGPNFTHKIQADALTDLFMMNTATTYQQLEEGRQTGSGGKRTLN